MHRRKVIVGAMAIVASSVVSPALAQESYPSRPIHLIVPAAPGGSTDMGTRVVAKLLGDVLGQPVMIENKPVAGKLVGEIMGLYVVLGNRPEAGGRLGPAEVDRATPDGYTLLYGNSIG